MMPTLSHLDSRKLSFYESDFLKGIAILSILINHFINMTADKTLDAQFFAGYANGIIIFFFILSGYGIYYSLKKSGYRNTDWKRFYLKRILRIYPLFILALIAFSFLNGTWPSISSFFFVHSPYWFIDAIVYCYLLTPVFLVILDKLTLNRFILFFCSSSIILGLLTYMTSDYTLPLPFIRYRYILFSFFLVYFGGMALMKYRDEISKNEYLNFPKVYLGIFIIFIILTRTPEEGLYQVINGTIFIYGGLLLIGSVIKTGCLKNIKLDILVNLGMCTFSIYLFQPIFYGLVYRITNHSALYSLILIIFCFPLFFAMCYFVEGTLKIYIKKVL